MVSEKFQGSYSGSFKRSDENIAQAAFHALELNVSVPPGGVKVRVQDGVVSLGGFVDWGYQKFAAGEAARYLPGVVSVDNKIKIKPKVHSRW